MDTKERANALSREIIGAAIEVHKALGPGLLESTYEACLCKELELRGIAFKRQVELPIRYKGLELSAGYRMDIVVDNLLILELKSVEKLIPVHEAQLLTYLRLSNIWLGLLLNFNVPVLKNGIKRLVQG
ncbi:MAG: GxxExxY protein [Chloroflexota bacterium]|nr:GxxExxY protein [Chloroflexota bacterium]